MGLPAIPHRGIRIRRFPLKNGETFVEGAMVDLDANGEVEAAAADAAALLGIAAHGAVLTNDPDPGYCLVFPFYPDTTMWVEGSASPVEADVGDQYGFVADSDGVAILDKTETSEKRFTIEGIDTVRDLYEVSCIAANRQLQA